jgi:hypothetical protein
MTTPPKKILIAISQVPVLKQADLHFKSLFAMMEGKEFRKEAERLVGSELDTISGLKMHIRKVANGFTIS